MAQEESQGGVAISKAESNVGNGLVPGSPYFDACDPAWLVGYFEFMRAAVVQAPMNVQSPRSTFDCRDPRPATRAALFAAQMRVVVAAGWDVVCSGGWHVQASTVNK